MAVDLNNHPGANPEYASLLEIRKEVLAHNAAQRRLARLHLPHTPVIKAPPQPNKYVPHIGAKQRAKALR